MAAKFLCCLPLRLGVIVISFCQFILCGALAGLLWFALAIAKEDNDLSAITQSMKTTVIVVGAIYTFAALVGLLGFFGAIFKKNGFVKSFYVLLCVVFGLEVGSSVWYLITFYRTRGQTLDDCINGSSDAGRIAYCKSLDAYKRVPQGAMLASIIVPILVHAYACYVVYQYTKRLERQKFEKSRASKSFSQPQPAYQPVLPHDENVPLTLPSVQYPYTDGPNSFGHVHKHSFDRNNASDKV
ncbi:hypothetical protein JR316_0002067 [Psilocybe cubensis]|uniref:Uncharacterized protein n=2 Tax=Psilocybe cubensis TaxID=181762 RepID=A0ACB8HBQ0_PSICU|nr:hypothetical protein JR316_0002067 [Psilocybe cubensis]KAH9485160.1 hypothetical protein JR316_0002067 [Psilocybe cubensis]